eukprot:CAMPEP_0197027700 /NCGR_PEP_ID=MMETSP1384-20130603/7564_1 /TAXON_ID=29189 /ORGANISM="Ammonia sp." /LENGTH=302 /DNA_ID=CAMNT_0042456585 /DNA_START=837 /DNA_END=1745 /DNA_ORIENTATION=+
MDIEEVRKKKEKEEELRKQRETMQAKQRYHRNVTEQRLVVYGYLRETRDELNVFVSSDIAEIVRNFCRICDLQNLIEARKYSVTVGKNLDDELLIMEALCNQYDSAVFDEILSSYNNRSGESQSVTSQFLRIAMQNRNEFMVTRLLGHWRTICIRDEDRVLRYLLSQAIENKMYKVAALLLSASMVKYIEFEPRPQCLWKALKGRDENMIQLVLNGLKRVKTRRYRFVCDEAFRECIKMDQLECAQTIVEQQWHSPSLADYALAEKYEGAIYFWLRHRRQSSLCDQYSILIDAGTAATTCYG